MFYLLVLIAAAVAIMIIAARGALEESDNRYQRSCMEKLVEPDADDPDYNDKALLYANDVRKCMRG
jgi:hypothetical protein